jgi:benzodiazapine receptor
MNEPPRSSILAQALGLVVSLILAFSAAGIGGIATASNLTPWYASLAKPSWNPPNWVFGPVWTVLYTLMGIAAWLVWRRGGPGGVPTMIPLSFYVLQLLLNALWSWLFFGWHRTGLAFADILLLWLAILVTILSFRRVSLTAAALLVPYLLWVSFATTLNGAIAWLN